MSSKTSLQCAGFFVFLKKILSAKLFGTPSLISSRNRVGKHRGLPGRFLINLGSKLPTKSGRWK
jgi:hypothetical protein